MSDAQEVTVDTEKINNRMARCLNVDDAEGAVICELALIGLKWNTNSALEEWFPMSSDRLFRLESENAELRQRLAGMTAQRDRWKASFDAAIRRLANIHALMCPDDIIANDGKLFTFTPNPDAVIDVWKGLSNAIRAIPKENADAIDAARRET